MSIVAEATSVITKTKELCEEIAKNANFLELQSQVERFLADDAARLQYQSVHERGAELNQKQQAGVELGKSEIADFESARDALFENPVAADFFSARGELEALQQEIGKWVGMTIEMGRLPTEEEIAEAGAGDCCGDHGEGGCGDHGEGGCGCH